MERQRIRPTLDSRLNDFDGLVIIFLTEVEVSQGAVSNNVFRLGFDSRKETLASIIGGSARKLDVTEEHEGIGVIWISRQHGFQKSDCAIFLICLQKRSNQRI